MSEQDSKDTSGAAVNKADNPHAHRHAADLFRKMFAVCEHQWEFDPVWREGTKHFPGLLRDPRAVKLAIGERVKFVDDHGLPAIVVGTDHGPVVVFQRWKNSPNAFRLNAPDVILEHTPRFRGYLDIERMTLVLLHADQL